MLQTLSYIINVAPDGVPQVVKLSQNENGRTLAFALTGVGTVNIPSGATVTISGTKPDGVVYSATGTLSGNVASFSETTQMTAVSGIWPAKIKVTYNGETIATCKIVMAIDPDPVAPGSVPSSSQLNGLVAEAQQYATYAKEEAYGSPLVAATAAAMTDKTRVYVYTGSETGKTAGHWYFWNGSAWADGGVYNSQGINTDTTLTISGMAADSGAVGAEFTHVKQDINEFDPLIDTLMEQGSLSAVNVGSPLRLVDTANTIRSAEFQNWQAGMTVQLNDGYQARLLLCDSNENYIIDASWAQTVTSTNTTATKVKVLIRKYPEAEITPSEVINAVISSDIPLTVVNPKANQSDFENLEDNVQNVSEDLSNIRDGLYVYDSIIVNLETGIYDRWNNLANVGKHCTVNVTKGEKYIVVAQSYSSTDYPVWMLKKGSTIVAYKNVSSAQMVQLEIDVNVDADTLIVNSAKAYISLQKGEAITAKPYSKWHGKKIAWFGTSIPETSTYNAVLGYPEYVGKLLGATVYNEAVGSSTARRGFKSAETANDPYGWTGMGQAALWSMGSTVAEKNEIITNWESKWRSLTGYNQALTSSMQTKAIACSYENKLMQYISTTPVDLFVFDHGYNDWKVGDISPDSSNMFDRSTFQGAMNTFIKAILEANPRARIVIISHYEDQERAGLIEMQDNEAKYWNLPFCKLHEKLGWANDRTITTDGYWSNGTGNGIWIAGGGTSQTISLKQYHMPDGRHPNTDISGHACMDIAYIIADFLNEITPA